MNRPYCNPTWTRQHSLAEFALRQCLPLTARNMDAYWWLIGVRNFMLDRGQA